MGTPQYYDTNNPLKLGGIIYTFYQQDNDSVLYKTCRMKELEEIGTFRPDSLTAKYFNIIVKESIKAEFNYLINYLKPLNDGRLPTTYRDPETIGCNLLGTWIAILTDSIGKRHYFNFPVYNLPNEIESLCRNIYSTGYPDSSRHSIFHNHINTDSIVESTLKLKTMESIELFQEPRTNIKFIPPRFIPKK